MAMVPTMLTVMVAPASIKAAWMRQDYGWEGTEKESDWPEYPRDHTSPQYGQESSTRVAKLPWVIEKEYGKYSNRRGEK